MNAYMTKSLRSPSVYRIEVPRPGPEELLIKVAYVSLNPTDPDKHAAMALPPSKVVGCDFSGTITSLGSSVDKSAFAPNDRVAGLIHGCHYSHTGAFAEYLTADAGLCFKVPQNVPLKEACTLGVGWISAMQAMYQRLYHDLKLPKDAEDTLLVYSAATNMGMHSIQQARIDYPSTFIIALASSQHHARLKQFGAHAVFDYKSPTVVSDVRKLGKDIRRGIDCHSEGESTVLTAQCMLPDGKSGDDTSESRRIIRTLPPSMIKGTLPTSVRADEWIVSYTALGKPFWFLFKHYAASPADYAAASLYMSKLPDLLRSGKVVPVPSRLMPGGLEGIGKGFEEMKAGKVRGEKFVYEVDGEEGSLKSISGQGAGI